MNQSVLAAVEALLRSAPLAIFAFSQLWKTMEQRRFVVAMIRKMAEAVEKIDALDK